MPFHWWALWCRGRKELVMCLAYFCVWTVLCSSLQPCVLHLTEYVLFFSLAGWFYSLSCCSATRTQSSSGYPAGKWHQGESEITSFAHCCQKRWHQISSAPTAERPQCRCAVQGNIMLSYRKQGTHVAECQRAASFCFLHLKGLKVISSVGKDESLDQYHQ